MRYWGPLFAVTLAIGGIWFWLEQRTVQDVVVADAQLDTPQMLLNGVVQRTTTMDGEWISSLNAQQVVHFDSVERVELIAPDWRRQQDSAVVHIVALSATLIDDHLWTLEHDVQVHHLPSDDHALRIRTEYLEYDTLRQYATTRAPVDIDQAEQMSTQAVGMDIDFVAEEFYLHEQVRTRYWP